MKLRFRNFKAEHLPQTLILTDSHQALVVPGSMLSPRIITVYLCTNPMREVTQATPFYRGGGRGSERLIDLPEVTQLVQGGTGCTRPSVSSAHILHLHGFSVCVLGILYPKHSKSTHVSSQGAELGGSGIIGASASILPMNIQG